MYVPLLFLYNFVESEDLVYMGTLEKIKEFFTEETVRRFVEVCTVVISFVCMIITHFNN